MVQARRASGQARAHANNVTTRNGQIQRQVYARDLKAMNEMRTHLRHPVERAMPTKTTRTRCGSGEAVCERLGTLAADAKRSDEFDGSAAIKGPGIILGFKISHRNYPISPAVSRIK